MNRRALTITGLLCLIFSVSAPANAEHETLASIFDRANEAFFQGEYGRAIEEYRRLEEAGVRDPDVYYNLAAAHGRSGELGYALLYLERAARLRPGDEDAQHELAQVRDALALRAAARSGEATMRTRPPVREALVSGISENALAGLLLVLEIAALLLFLARRRPGGENRILALTVAAVLTTVLSVVCGAGLIIKSGVGQDGAPAVVVTRDTLREGPDDRAQARGEVEEGVLSTVLMREGEWVQVRVPDGPRGWLHAASVGLLVPD